MYSTLLSLNRGFVRANIDKKKRNAKYFGGNLSNNIINQ